MCFGFVAILDNITGPKNTAPTVAIAGMAPIPPVYTAAAPAAPAAYSLDRKNKVARPPSGFLAARAIKFTVFLNDP